MWELHVLWLVPVKSRGLLRAVLCKSPHPWRCSKDVYMWHFRIWFTKNGGIGWMVGLDDLRGLFQPMIL